MDSRGNSQGAQLDVGQQSPEMAAWDVRADNRDRGSGQMGAIGMRPSRTWDMARRGLRTLQWAGVVLSAVCVVCAAMPDRLGPYLPDVLAAVPWWIAAVATVATGGAAAVGLRHLPGARVDTTPPEDQP